MKSKLAVDFADLVYNGKWFTPLREALTAFAVDTQKYVTGTVKLKLYKGNIITASVTSPCTLYSENLVTFEESDYDQKDSQGFINLWGLPDKVQALREPVPSFFAWLMRDLAWLISRRFAFTLRITML